MTGALVLRREVVGAIAAHATAELPNEACGLVSGRDRIGARFHPARNALASPYRFDVEPADLVRIILGIEGAGDELVAIVHSHPATAPVPSATDRREARYAVPQLIVAVQPFELRAWLVEGTSTRELTLRVIDDQQSVSRLSRMARSSGASTTSIEHELSSFPER